MISLCLCYKPLIVYQDTKVQHLIVYLLFYSVIFATKICNKATSTKFENINILVVNVNSALYSKHKLKHETSKG